MQNASKEPADHMAAELEFMMYLYANKGLALKEQNREKLSQIEENIDEFEKLHFSKWAVPFFSCWAKNLKYWLTRWLPKSRKPV